MFAIIGCLLATTASVGSHLEAAIASSCYGQFDYADILTGTAQVTTSDPTCQSGYYFGWVGVNGQIQAPSHFPSLGGTKDHSVGYLMMGFHDNPPGPLGYSFVQTGWLAGCLAENGQQLCATPSTGLLSYTEMYFDAVNQYFVNEGAAGGLAYGSTSIFRIEWDGVHCWNLYMNYNTWSDALCDWTSPPAPVPRSGAAEMISETDSHYGIRVEMPTTIYGYSNPNTNNALRIKGAAGYAAWTPTLSTGGTVAWDERYDNPTTYVSPFNPDYKMEGCGSC